MDLYEPLDNSAAFRNYDARFEPPAEPTATLPTTQAEINALIEDREPTWSITHQTADEQYSVTCEVYEDEVMLIFGYVYDWPGVCDGFHEAAWHWQVMDEPDTLTPEQARQYAMNGGGDTAMENDVPWHPRWQQWIETGETT